MSENDYFIGLDVGTDSVGWAATDSDFKTLRIKGKTAWGSRLFQAANSSQERRSFRSNRRRKERRKYRISLLNELFADEINNIDSSFS